MEIYGISPIEAAFEVIGLTNAKLIMDFLFFKTALGAVSFFIGILLTLWVSAKKGNFRYFLGFLFLFICLWVLFIVPTSKNLQPVSTMEQNGFDNIQTEEILESVSNREEAPMLLTFISKFFNSIVIGAVQTISLGVEDENFNYLKNPFLINKISLQTKNFVGAGIKDPDLKKRVGDFYYDYYLPTLSIMQNTKNIDNDQVWWPGHEIVKANYSEEALSEWEKLYGNLRNYVSKNDNSGYLLQLIRFVKGGIVGRNQVNDELIMSLLKTDINSLVQANVENSKKETGFLGFIKGVFLNELAQEGSAAVAVLMQTTTYIVSRAMLKVLPYIQGYSSLIMFSMFPVTLLFTILFRKITILLNYLRFLFWVKSWVIFWAIINYTAIYMAKLQGQLSPDISWFWERPYFNLVTNLFLLMTPVISMYLLEGFVQGVGQIASSATLNIDKGVGKVEGKVLK